MTLSTEEAGEFPDVDTASLDEVLGTDAFGKFAILFGSDSEHIQAGNDWNPREDCARFLRELGSDPWIIEYRTDGRQFRAVGRATLEQVIRAFRSYLAGGSVWRTGFTWDEIEV